jgi:hypothetical protein
MTREHHRYVYWAWKLQELQKKKFGNLKNCERRNVVCNRVNRKVTLCFIPYPLFQWYRQSEEIWLNLGMKCWNSASNAQGSWVIIVVVQVGVVKIYVAAVQALRKRKHKMKLSLWPKLVEKLVWVPVIFFRKIFIPNYGYDALLCRNWPFSPPNRLNLRITLIPLALLVGNKEY